MSAIHCAALVRYPILLPVAMSSRVAVFRRAHATVLIVALAVGILGGARLAMAADPTPGGPPSQRGLTTKDVEGFGEGDLYSIATRLFGMTHDATYDKQGRILASNG